MSPGWMEHNIATFIFTLKSVLDHQILSKRNVKAESLNYWKSTEEGSIEKSTEL